MELKWSKSWFCFCEFSWYSPKADLLDSWNTYFVTECFLKGRFGKTRRACTLWYLSGGPTFTEQLLEQFVSRLGRGLIWGSGDLFTWGPDTEKWILGPKETFLPLWPSSIQTQYSQRDRFWTYLKSYLRGQFFPVCLFLCADCHFFVTRGRGWTFDWPLRGLCVATFRTSPPIFCTFLHFPGPCVLSSFHLAPMHPPPRFKLKLHNLSLRPSIYPAKVKLFGLKISSHFP